MAEHGHLRCADLATCWLGARYGEQMAQRTVRSLVESGELMPRRNAHGGLSYVLTRPGAGALEVRGIAARHGLDLASVSGPTFAHFTFTKDCCDREILAWRAWPGKGLPGEPVREMLIEAVEKRFGCIEAVPDKPVLEFLTDNGGAYIAHETRRVASSLGLKPVNTPVCSPQSNGMAESFVNTFRRDYLCRMDLADAATVLAQLPSAFEHFNEIHPHSSLRMRSPREFRRHRALRQDHTGRVDQTLHCE